MRRDMLLKVTVWGIVFAATLLSAAAPNAAMQSNAASKLKDIKPLVEIPDISRYLYWGVLLLALVSLVAVGYFLYSKFRKIRKIDQQKAYLEILNSIDWSSPKKAAYKATHYGRLLAEDERRKAIYAQLLPLLERYKYKKEVDKADEETMRTFELYKRICNESV